MPDSWFDLLQAQIKDAVPRCKRVLIVCSPNIESSRQFEARFLPTGVQTINETLNILGFDSTSLEIEAQGGELDHVLDLDVYTVPFPVITPSVKYLKAFVDLQDQDFNIHFVFLLDWAMADQRFWLRKINSSLLVLVDAGFHVSEGFTTICCLNSEHIYTWQKNTTQWLTKHIEFVQLTLRSFCISKECSLIYCTSTELSEKSEVDQTVFKHVITKDFARIPADFANSSKLVIPFGADSLELVKNVSGSFDPTLVVKDEFISGKYETYIPCFEDLLRKEKLGINELPPIGPYKVDIQHELSRIFDRVQSKQDPQSS